MKLSGHITGEEEVNLILLENTNTYGAIQKENHLLSTVIVLELNVNRKLTLELDKNMIKALFQLVYGKRITIPQAKNTVTGIQHKSL